MYEPCPIKLDDETKDRTVRLCFNQRLELTVSRQDFRNLLVSGPMLFVDHQYVDNGRHFFSISQKYRIQQNRDLVFLGNVRIRKKGRKGDYEVNMGLMLGSDEINSRVVQVVSPKETSHRIKINPDNILHIVLPTANPKLISCNMMENLKFVGTATLPIEKPLPMPSYQYASDEVHFWVSVAPKFIQQLVKRPNGVYKAGAVYLKTPFPVRIDVALNLKNKVRKRLGQQGEFSPAAAALADSLVCLPLEEQVPSIKRWAESSPRVMDQQPQWQSQPIILPAKPMGPRVQQVSLKAIQNSSLDHGCMVTWED